ncbi:MAG: branched-chain amino acid transaminase [Bacteroidales bacterium]|nr:MAG: branched-chain amino acid transaminase [Bacteroidales bacterium]
MNYYNEKTEVYLNGNWVPASSATTSLYDQTLHYGTGVFEGIRSYKTPNGAKIFKAKEHFERLQYSAKVMHLDLNLSVDELIDLTYETLKRNNLEDAYIRPLVWAGPNMSLTPTTNVYVFICAWEWGKLHGGGHIRVMTSSYRRPDPKSCHVSAKAVGHYVNSILATTEAKQNGFDDALLTDANGNVAEGPGANFFFQKGKTLFTSPLGNILPGITRATVLEIAKKRGFDLQERYFKVDEVKDADSAFFVGTAAEVACITSLDNVPFTVKWEDSLGYIVSNDYQQLIRI